MRKRIVYITDKFKVSQGYEPAFTRVLASAGIKRNQVVLADIYSLVSKPVKRYGNEKAWKFNDEARDQIAQAFAQRVEILRPDIIVVSCPACLGILVDWDKRAASIDKLRGGVYDYKGIPVIVVYPITAIHRRVDERIIEGDEGDKDVQNPYRVKDGAQILTWDWQKVGRFLHGKQRKTPAFKYSICRTPEDLRAAYEYAKGSVFRSTDIETGLHPPTQTCVGYTFLHKTGDCHSFVIPFFDTSQPGNVFWQDEDEHLMAWETVEAINELPIPTTMQNGSYDASYFIRDRIPIWGYLFDSMYMWWALYMELPKKLDFISSILLDDYQYWKDDIKGQEEESASANMESYWRYNALDCHSTLFNTLYLAILLSRNPKYLVTFNDAMRRCYSGLMMSMKGVRVDWKRRDYHREQLESAMEEKVEELRYILDDPEFNINSPAHKKSLIYDVFGLPKRNDKGRIVKGNAGVSAGKIPMRLAKSSHPFFRDIIETMEAALEPRVQLSNLFGFSDDTKPYGVRGGLFMPTGRFRTAFTPVGTETGRFSSKKSHFWDGGNAQNIRKDYRDWLIPEDGCVFLDVDYSQSDDVFIAYESQDANKIAVVESGKDAHSLHGELFFGVPYDDIVAGKKAGDSFIVHPITGIRQIAKRVVHGTNFQMAGYTLYVTMGRESVVQMAKLLGHEGADSWEEDRLVYICEVLMRKYRQKYPRLTNKEWYADVATLLAKTGEITNAYGVTRRFIGDATDNGTQREATAYYGQSNTSGNMNRVMYEIDHGYIPPTFRDGPNPDAGAKPLKMSRASHGLEFCLQVHDNFVCQLDMRHDRWREAAHNLLQVMNRPVIIHGREVRIAAEAEIGIRWGKGMIEWDGKDPRDIENIVAKLKAA